MLVYINESELCEQINFVEQQNTIYRYHNHPQAEKMELLYNFLKKIDNYGKEQKNIPVTDDSDNPTLGQQSLFKFKENL